MGRERKKGVDPAAPARATVADNSPPAAGPDLRRAAGNQAVAANAIPTPEAEDSRGVITRIETRGHQVVTTETLVRDGLESRLVTVFDPLTSTRSRQLFRRSTSSPEWTDVSKQAAQATYLNPPGVEPGDLSIEWNMPPARPGRHLPNVGELVSEVIVAEVPPSLVIPYVKDSILTEHFEFTPAGEHPYQHWAGTIGRRWSAVGARKTTFWLNKVVTVAGAGVAATGTVINAGRAASALRGVTGPGLRSLGAGAAPFDMSKEFATKEEMVQGIREIETGVKRSQPGKALDAATHQLSDLQRRALQENVRLVIKKSISAVRDGTSNARAVVAQMANPRFRFLNQVPEARQALIDALQTIGVELPNGW